MKLSEVTDPPLPAGYVGDPAVLRILRGLAKTFRLHRRAVDFVDGDEWGTGSSLPGTIVLIFGMKVNDTGPPYDIRSEEYQLAVHVAPLAIRKAFRDEGFDVKVTEGTGDYNGRWYSKHFEVALSKAAK